MLPSQALLLLCHLDNVLVIIIVYTSWPPQEKRFLCPSFSQFTHACRAGCFSRNRVQLAPLARRRAVPTTESEWVPVKSVRRTKWRSADVPE